MAKVDVLKPAIGEAQGIPFTPTVWKEWAKRQLESLIHAMPRKLKVLMKETPIIEPLDYPGIRLWINSWPEYHIRRVSCKREPGTVKFIEKMKPGDVLYDVGANVGVYSLIAAKRGHPVHAFEPMGVNFGTLLKNIKLNQASTVQPWMVALSDQTGTDTFHVSDMDSASSCHALGAPIDYLNRPFLPSLTYQVISYRLEDFVHRYNLPKPTHIKIDVDGIEFKVLKGCRSLLHTAKSVMVELENEDKETGPIHDYMRQFGLTTNVEHRDYENVSNWEFSR